MSASDRPSHCSCRQLRRGRPSRADKSIPPPARRAGPFPFRLTMPMVADGDLGLLNSLARTLSQSLELDEVLGSALDRVAELLKLETGWVWILDETTGEPRLAASRNLPPGLIEHPELMEGDCY